MLLIPLIPGLVDAGMRHVHAHALPVRRAKRVGRVDPTVRVQHVLRDLFRVHAHDGRAYVLSGCNYEGEGEQDHHCDAVVQPEHASIRVKSTDFY